MWNETEYELLEALVTFLWRKGFEIDVDNIPEVVSARKISTLHECVYKMNIL